MNSSDLARLDREFGWRWLLGRSPGDPIALFGFECGDFGRLFDEEGTVWRGRPCAIGTSVLVNADSTVSDRAEVREMIRDGASVAVIGRASNVRRWRARLLRFDEFREYGLLPGSSPRVIVPLGHARWIRHALALHRPGRALARAGVRLAGALSRVGLARMLFRSRLYVARHTTQPDASEAGGVADAQGITDAHPHDFALYLGTADENRKTVVLPLGSGVPRAIIKIGRTTVARESLLREARNLQALEETSLADRVPRLIDLRENGHQVALRMEYRPRRAARTRLVAMGAEAFLAELGALGRGEARLSKWLERDDLAAALQSAGALGSVLERAASRGAMLQLQRIHGDFTPWNCSWTDAGFFVFDWEEGRPGQLACSDAFSYVIAPALLIERRADPVRVVTNALELAGRVARRIALTPSDLPIHLAAWLLARSAKQYEPRLVALLAEVARRVK